MMAFGIVVQYTGKMFIYIYMIYFFFTSAMKTITTSFKGMFDQPAPRWVEPKIRNYLINSFLQ